MVAGDTSAPGRPGLAAVVAVLEQVIVMLQRCPVLQLVDVSRFVAAFWELGPAFHSHAVRYVAGGTGEAVVAAMLLLHAS